MTLKGEIRINGEAKPSSLPLQARAEHDFPERILAVNSKGLPEKSARLYETAKAAITKLTASLEPAAATSRA